MSFRGNLLRVGLPLIGLSLLVWYPLRWWPGDWFFPVRLLNYFTPWLLLILIPVLALTLLIRKQGVWWPMIALPTLLVGLPLMPLFFPRGEAGPATGQPLKVMSYSICSYNRNISAVTQVIRQVEPDLLLMQELEPAVAKRVADQLTDLYPEGTDKFNFAYAPSVKQAIVSRYPLTSLGVAREQGRAQIVRVETPTGSIMVWNVHARQPEVWTQDYEVHYREFLALVGAVRKVDGAVIVAGDFNSTEQAQAYQLMARYLHNAHWEAGWGFGFTYPASSASIACGPIDQLPIMLWPMVRIDHIFFSDHFFARQARTLADSGGSDHLPVVAELWLIK